MYVLLLEPSTIQTGSHCIKPARAALPGGPQTLVNLFLRGGVTLYSGAPVNSQWVGRIWRGPVGSSAGLHEVNTVQNSSTNPTWKLTWTQSSAQCPCQCYLLLCSLCLSPCSSSPTAGSSPLGLALEPGPRRSICQIHLLSVLVCRVKHTEESYYHFHFLSVLHHLREQSEWRTNCPLTPNSLCDFGEVLASQRFCFRIGTSKPPLALNEICCKAFLKGPEERKSLEKEPASLCPWAGLQPEPHIGAAPCVGAGRRGAVPSTLSHPHTECHDISKRMLGSPRGRRTLMLSYQFLWFCVCFLQCWASNPELPPC